MSKKSLYNILAALVLAAMILSACAPAATEAPVVEEPVATEAPTEAPKPSGKLLVWVQKINMEA